MDNLEVEKPNVLRIVRMKSYAGFESNLFSSDHAAWRETTPTSEEIEKLSSLRWTDVSMTNAVQFWRIVPSGFGSYFDVRCGSIWIIVATPTAVEEGEVPDFFSHWDRYVQDFSPISPTFGTDTRLDSIRLEPGNRL